MIRRFAKGLFLPWLVFPWLVGCGLLVDRADLLNRERERYGYTNELQTLRELREQLAQEEDVLEIYLSELDRNERIAGELRQKIDQERGRVASSDAALKAEQGKVQGLEKQTNELKKKQAELTKLQGDLQKQIQGIQKTVDRLTQEVSTKEAERVELEKRRQAAAAAVEGLKKSLPPEGEKPKVDSAESPAGPSETEPGGKEAAKKPAKEPAKEAESGGKQIDAPTPDSGGPPPTPSLDKEPSSEREGSL